MTICRFAQISTIPRLALVTDYLEQILPAIQLTGQLREESFTSQQRGDVLRLCHNWKKI